MNPIHTSDTLSRKEPPQGDDPHRYPDGVFGDTPCR